MDIWHRVGRIVRFSNLGTLLFFTLNILLIVAVFGSSGSIVELICIYFFTVAISRILRVKNRRVPKFEKRTILPTRCQISIMHPPFIVLLV